MIDVSLHDALLRIKEECNSHMHCEDCPLYWICPYLRTAEQPPYKWDADSIVKGCGKRVYEESDKEVSDHA